MHGLPIILIEIREQMQQTDTESWTKSQSHEQIAK